MSTVWRRIQGHLRDTKYAEWHAAKMARDKKEDAMRNAAKAGHADLSPERKKELDAIVARAKEYIEHHPGHWEPLEPVVDVSNRIVVVFKLPMYIAGSDYADAEAAYICDHLREDSDDPIFTRGGNGTSFDVVLDLDNPSERDYQEADWENFKATELAAIAKEEEDADYDPAAAS